MALRKAQSHQAEPRAESRGEAILSEKRESIVMWDILNFARNFFERN